METREIYWNIQGIWVMYLLFVAMLGIFGYGMYRDYRVLTLGKPENRLGNWPRRLGQLVLHALLQGRILRERYSGTMHALFFFGFLILTLGTVVVFLDEDLGLHIMRGPFYLYFQSLVVDVFGLLAIVGVLMALLKRFAGRPDRLRKPSRLDNVLGDAGILGLFLLILVTGFVIEGARIVATNDPWAAWSPVGRATGMALQGLGFSVPALASLHGFTWWFHLLIAFAFLAYIPYSKLRHIFFSSASIYLQALEPMGALKPIDMEAAETLGTPKFEDFMWKRLLDAEACTECGRCQAVCPAYAAGQPLSPKAVILDLRNALYRARGIPVFPASPPSPAGKGDGGLGPDESPTVAAVTPEALWSCVTCGACMEQCPVFIEHVPAIVDMRRYLTMEKAEYPELMQDAITSMENRGHPFRGTAFSRTDWCDGLGVKIVADGGPAEWLYWVGCAAALDERNQRVARAFATVLQRAGVDFAILGDEESCTGDFARRIGNEYLFQTMAQQNVETLNRYGIKKIVTACPHCLNTLKNEYPQFGGTFEVVHHTELIARLVQEGKLSASEKTVESLTFHDSCYLARYNRISDAPRAVLGALPGVEVREMERSRERTFCCGGGSGHLWYEETEGGRINHERAEQALATNAGAVGTSCPFCMIMLTDGTKAKAGDRDVKVLDVAELVEMSTRAPSAS